ncbi:hypothetical protein GCM10009836_20230 [Pseudonocardia ailaonensis]|uniref:Uncharacterized protein n=1 Tax=Pseudonocardia ailaonensis TaxID=367279 RepID=A0ABN2MVY7_9PSEU
MDYLVRVNDTTLLRPGFSTFLDLPDLLTAIWPVARTWTWSMQRMPETSLPEGSAFGSLAEIEARMEGPRGWVMSFEELYDFSRQVGQIVWGEFLAAERPDQLPRPEDDDVHVAEHAFAGLCAFDSSFWYVGGPARMIQQIEARFDDVEHVGQGHWARADR